MSTPEGEVTPGTVKYAILGCGRYGSHLLREIAHDPGGVIIIDNSEDRVRELRDQHVEAFVRDITHPGFLEGIPPFAIAFILTQDNMVNVSALKTILSRKPRPEVAVRAEDPIAGDEADREGADLILSPPLVYAKAAVTQMAAIHANRIARRLFTLLSSWDGCLGIVTHNNPDPDAIASALALAAITHEANGKRLSTKILYDGVIGHQENRTLVNLLDIRMDRITPQALAGCNYLALVDSPAPGVNNPLRSTDRVSIIIDHHGETTHAGQTAGFTDIRSGVGATASILTQYLKELDIPIGRDVATALLYGIRSDTREFRRNVTPQDLANASFLLPLTDPDLTEKITSPSLSMETLDVLGLAIRNRKIRSGYLFSNVGYVRNRDALPQAADLLISLEGVNTALVYGISDDTIIMSVRNRDVRLHIGNVLSEAYGEIGDAGGHPNMAAAAIPLAIFSCVAEKEDLLDLVIGPIISRFSTIVGLEEGGKDEI
ncbi:MAG: DHH family phosphoesterase [Methanomicrobiales archaeon]|jgi:nanoRNase/pAp phosphatase (c-di-AMP/oligoRNAs hydrolase)|nr:DHH family phosphoesterase [Methanomicrobiales archaeon]